MKGWNIFTQDQNSKLVKENMSKKLRLSEKYIQVLNCVHFHGERMWYLVDSFGTMKDFYNIYGRFFSAKYKKLASKNSHQMALRDLWQ